MAATAIVVPFRDIPAAVDRRRRALTSDGADGMPPHVTLIYPFVDDNELGGHEIGRLQAALGGFAPFDVRFVRFGRFDSEPPVLYLEPDPSQPFRDMIAMLTEDFPAFPPFGGIHETVIPHLTVCQTDDATAMGAVEDEIAPNLPIRTRVAEVALMEHPSGGWRPREHIVLTA